MLFCPIILLSTVKPVCIQKHQVIHCESKENYSKEWRICYRLLRLWRSCCFGDIFLIKTYKMQNGLSRKTPLNTYQGKNNKQQGTVKIYDGLETYLGGHEKWLFAAGLLGRRPFHSCHHEYWKNESKEKDSEAGIKQVASNMIDRWKQSEQMKK